MRALLLGLTVLCALGVAAPASAAERCTAITNTCIELTANPNPVGTSSSGETKYLSVAARVVAKGPLPAGQASVTADIGQITGAGAFHSAGTTRGRCSVSGQVVTCNLGPLQIGETATAYVVLESPQTAGTITVPTGAFRLSVNERTADNPTRDPRVDTVDADGTSTEATESNELTWVPAFTPVTIWAGDPKAVAPSCANKASTDDAGDCLPLSPVEGVKSAVPSTGTTQARAAAPVLPVGPDLNNLQNGAAYIPSNTGQYQARFLECGATDANTETTCADVVTVCPYSPSSSAFVNCLRQGSTWDASIAYPGPKVSCAAGSEYQCSGPLRFDLYWDPSLIPPGQTADVCTASGCKLGNFVLFHFDDPVAGQVAQLQSSDVVSRRCGSPNPTSITSDCIYNPHFDPKTGYFTVTLFSNENGRMR